MPNEQLAWRYLHPESRIRRCSETLEIFSVRLGRRLLEVDVSLPRSSRGHADWMVPVVFLSKAPTAPDLKVSDGGGTRITVPTMVENMAITCSALDLLAADAKVALDGIVPELIRQVVFEEPVDAEIALSVLEEEAPQIEFLYPLLDKLFDQFLLWVPLKGVSGSDHQISISRRAPRRLDPILRPSVEEVSFSYPLPDGWADFVIEVRSSHKRPDRTQLFERLLLAFGLRSIEIESELDDTSRFASYHHCVRAPRGFVVREIRVGCPRGEGHGVAGGGVERIDVPVEATESEDAGLMPASLEEEPHVPARTEPDVFDESAGLDADGESSADDDEELELEEIEPGPGLLVQGHDSEIAHVHCSREENVSPLAIRTTLATAAHLTSLWTFVVVLSAVLLWVFERRGLAAAAEAGGRLEVAAGALLLVPTLAAAWAIRSDEGAATRLVLSGTRALLLLCGVLSVSAALTLASILPTDFGPITGLKLYATAAYVAAVLVSASWILSLRPTWYLYRHWLRTPLTHLRVTVFLVVLAALVSLLAPLSRVSQYASALLLLCIGLCLVAVAANRIGAPLGESRGPAPRLAALASVVAFVCTGYWLDYYHGPASGKTVQFAAVSAFALLGAAACKHRELFSRRVAG